MLLKDRETFEQSIIWDGHISCFLKLSRAVVERSLVSFRLTPNQITACRMMEIAAMRNLVGLEFLLFSLIPKQHLYHNTLRPSLLTRFLEATAVRAMDSLKITQQEYEKAISIYVDQGVSHVYSMFPRMTLLHPNPDTGAGLFSAFFYFNESDEFTMQEYVASLVKEVHDMQHIDPDANVGGAVFYDPSGQGIGYVTLGIFGTFTQHSLTLRRLRNRLRSRAGPANTTSALARTYGIHEYEYDDASIPLPDNAKELLTKTRPDLYKIHNSTCRNLDIDSPPSYFPICGYLGYIQKE